MVTGMENQIIMEQVNKYYGKKQALKDISLTIDRGMFGLLGRNGAGKSTLMKILATLHAAQSGSITVCGIPIEKSKEIRRKCLISCQKVKLVDIR